MARSPKSLALCLFLFSLIVTNLTRCLADENEIEKEQQQQQKLEETKEVLKEHEIEFSFGQSPLLKRTDVLVVKPSQIRQSGRSEGPEKVIVNLDPNFGNLEGLIENGVEQNAKTESAIKPFCVEVLKDNPKLCTKFLIELSKSDKVDNQIDAIRITTVMDFKTFAKHADVTYHRIDSPERFDFESDVVLYSSDELDNSLPLKLRISAKNIDEQTFSEEFAEDGEGSVATTYPLDSVPKSISFPYQTLDMLLELNEVVKSVSVSSMRGYAHFTYSGELQSLRQAVTVPFTSFEMDQYINERVEDKMKVYTRYFSLSPQYSFESFSVSDKVGKNYFYRQNMNNIMLQLRYPLMSNWKTDFTVKYKVNLKSMLSSNAEDGSTILRMTNGENDAYRLRPGGSVKTIINLPEGATVNKITAPHAQNIATEEIQGLVRSYVRITIVHDRSLTSKINISYFDNSSMITNAITLFCYVCLPLIVFVTLLMNVDFSIENSQEVDDLNAQKKQLAKMCRSTKTYLKMLNNFNGILENYKAKKDIDILNQAFQLFRQNCSLFLEKELQPYIVVCENKTIIPLISQISEAHQQHIEALNDFHHGKISRQTYIQNRGVINDVIEQAQKEIITKL